MWLILPKVVGPARIAIVSVAFPCKEPEIAVEVDPGYGGLPGSGIVRGGMRSQCAVDSRLIYCVASAHPRPFHRGRIELPKIVEIATIDRGIVTLAPKEPEIAIAVGPGHSAEAGSGHVRGGRRCQRAVDSGLGMAVYIRANYLTGNRAFSAHPGPFVL